MFGGGDGTHPCGARSVPCGSLPGTSQNAASGPIKARFHDIFSKVSQNRVVSPKYIEKASHTPYFQNGLQKSALEILGFPISLAFSHKELMGHFNPWVGLYCQNDEVSPNVHHWSSRERGVRYPHMSTQQAAPGDMLLI